MHRGKRYKNAAEKFDRETLYELPDAVSRVKDACTAKFDETIELSANLGVDPRHADQQVRGVVRLPGGTGKTVRIVVFAEGEAEKIAREAGADDVGGDDLVKKRAGNLHFFMDGLGRQPDSKRAAGQGQDDPLPVICFSVYAKHIESILWW